VSAPWIDVAGSVNLDIVATGPRLPAPGETVTGATLSRHPGGKGGNQALAARRLGAEVRLAARVGRDAEADQALALLKADGVDLSGVVADPEAATGVALIAVSADGENQIIVAPGANEALTPDDLGALDGDALIAQLEIPVETVLAAAERASGLVCLNLAPQRQLPDAVLAAADLIVVNEIERAFYGEALDGTDALVALTLGAKGAELRRGAQVLARAASPPVDAVDTVGAGDTFVAALTLALLEDRAPQAALDFACRASALAVTRRGAQTSLPWRSEVEPT